MSLIVPTVAFTIVAGRELYNKRPVVVTPQPAAATPSRLAKILIIPNRRALAASATRSPSAIHSVPDPPYAEIGSVRDSAR
jgi:hypothetical protein